MSARNEIKPEDCPSPYWHDTHRYCPVCSWTEDYGKPAMSEQPYTPTTDENFIAPAPTETEKP